jgi:predicted transcriptional regulator
MNTQTLHIADEALHLPVEARIALVDVLLQSIHPTAQQNVNEQASEHDAWFRRQVQAGLNSANAGHLFTAEEVEAEFVQRRAETHRKLDAAS